MGLHKPLSKKFAMQQKMESPNINLFRMESISLGIGVLAGVAIAIILRSLFLGLVAAPVGTFLYSLVVAVRERISTLD